MSYGLPARPLPSAPGPWSRWRGARKGAQDEENGSGVSGCSPVLRMPLESLLQATKPSSMAHSFGWRAWAASFLSWGSRPLRSWLACRGTQEEAKEAVVAEAVHQLMMAGISKSAASCEQQQQEQREEEEGCCRLWACWKHLGQEQKPCTITTAHAFCHCPCLPQPLAAMPDQGSQAWVIKHGLRARCIGSLSDECIAGGSSTSGS